MFKWKEGPRSLGCVYHKQAYTPLESDTLGIDVFVMPKIAKRRPIAITVGRYRRPQEPIKKQWQIQRPDQLALVEAELPRLLVSVGVQAEDAKRYTQEVVQLLQAEKPALEAALEEARNA